MNVKKIVSNTIIGFFALGLITLVFLWSFSPILVRYFGNEALAHYQLSVADKSVVRINPFNASVTVKNFQLNDDESVTKASLIAGKVQISIWQLLLKKIEITEFVIEDFQVDAQLSGEELIIAGFNLSELQTSSESEANLNVQENNVQVNSGEALGVFLPDARLINFQLNAIVNGQNHSLTIKELLLKDLRAVGQEINADIKVEGLVNQSELSLIASIEQVNENGNFDLQFNLDGFQLSHLQPLLMEYAVELAGDVSLSFDANVQTTPDTTAILIPDLVLSLNGLQGKYENWITQSAAQTLNIKNLDAQLASDSSVTLTSEMTYGLQDFSLAQDDPENQIVSLKSLNVLQTELNWSEDLQIRNNGIEFENLQALNASGIENPLLSLDQFKLSSVDFSESRANIGFINLVNLNADVRLDENGEMIGIPDFSSSNTESSQNTDAETEPDSTSSDEAFYFDLTGLEFSGSSEVSFQDQSVTPEFSETFVIESLKVGRVTNVDINQATDFEVITQTGKYTKLSVVGAAQPFTEKVNANAKIEVTEYSLPKVSSYVRDAMGIDLVTGQLDSVIDISINEDQLEGESVINVAGLKLGNTNNFDEQDLKNGAAMPLNQAINTLKDKNDNLELKVPVKGDISDPSFGLGSFASILIKKAAMTKTRNFLIDLFVPYSKVVKISLSGADLLLKVRFEPLHFGVQQFELDEEQKEYLSQMAQLMKDRPKLIVKTCATVVPEDNGYTTVDLDEEQVKALIEIGDKREDLVKTHLIELGVESERILYCLPEVNFELDTTPKIRMKT